MADHSNISWTTSTWSFLRGCSIASEGCLNCYAPLQVRRRMHEPGMADLTKMTERGVQWTGKIAVDEAMLERPKSWRTGRHIFINSLSDIFHEKVPYETLVKAFSIMAECQHHTFQALTKRAERMADLMLDPEFEKDVKLMFDRESGVGGKHLSAQWPGWPLPNLWVGVSTENQRRADERIPALLRTPAAIRFLSCEPLLGPIDLTRVGEGIKFNALAPGNRKGIDWVIAGGESGHKARPMHPDWARGLRDQCRAVGTAYWFKQVGQWAWEVPEGLSEAVLVSLIDPEGRMPGQKGFDEVRSIPIAKVGKGKAGELLDGALLQAFPHAPEITLVEPPENSQPRNRGRLQSQKPG